MKSIEVGDIVSYGNGSLAVVLDKIDDFLYLFNENGFVDSVTAEYVSPTGEFTELVDLLMLKLHATEA